MITPNFKNFKIEAYKPGKSKVNKLKNVIKLSANESALGMSPKAKKIISNKNLNLDKYPDCLLYTSPSPRDLSTSRMPSSA